MIFIVYRIHLFSSYTNYMYIHNHYMYVYIYISTTHTYSYSLDEMNFSMLYGHIIYRAIRMKHSASGKVSHFSKKKNSFPSSPIILSVFYSTVLFYTFTYCTLIGLITPIFGCTIIYNVYLYCISVNNFLTRKPRPPVFMFTLS